MKKVYLVALAAIFTWLTQAQPLTGTKTIPGDYASIAAAVADLNTNGVGTGGVTFNVSAGHTENVTAPILLTATGTASDPIVFQKAGLGTNPTITRTDAGTLTTSAVGAQGDAVLIIQGGDFITFNSINVSATNSGIEYGYYFRKASDVDASKNVTIQNCTVTMTKGTSGFVIGIYISNNVPASTVSVATGVTVTSTGGRSENISILGCTVTNVHWGIAARGFGHGTAPFDFYDQNIVIGSSGNGNTINDFGGGSATASYGVFSIFQNDIKIEHNTITPATAHNAILYAIFLSTANNGSSEVNHNTITMNMTSGVTSTMSGIYYSKGTTGHTSSTANCKNNTIVINRTSATSGITYYIYSTTNAPFNFNIEDNDLGGTTLNQIGGTGTINVIGQISTVTNIKINNNTIRNIRRLGTTSTAVFIGINSVGGVATGTAEVIGNTIHSLTSDGSTGILSAITTGGTFPSHRIRRNNIYNLTTQTASGQAYGIRVSAQGSVIDNNLISDIKTPASTNANAVRGISIESTTALRQHYVYYNTIYLDASSTGSGFGSSGIFHTYSATATSGELFMRNNIIVNNSTPTGTGLTVAFRRSAATDLNNVNITSNNCLHAGTPSTANLLFSDGTNNLQTIAAFASHMGSKNALTFTEIPPFINVTTPPFDLQVSTTTPTQIESAGTPISVPFAITTDYANATRNATTPDVGAFEGSYILLDLIPPVISYTPLLNTSSTSSRTLTATITDVSGVPTSGTGLPVLYWRNYVVPVPLTASATYTTGDIQTDFGFTSLPGSSTCPGTLTVTIPSGAVIVGVDVSYTMTALGSGFMSEQRSQLRCTSPGGTSEATLAVGIGATTGTFAYSRTGLNIANGVSGGGAINFELHAGRTFGGSGCDLTFNKVDNNSWTVTVYYFPTTPPPPPAYTSATGTHVGGNNYQFTFGGGVSLGETVEYYIAAQDNAPTPNVGVFPSSGAGGFTSNPPAASTPPTNPSSYVIVTPISGTFTVGTGGTYATLTGPGGLFADINLREVSGNIIAEIIDDISTETGANALNQFNEVGPGGYTLTIRPQTASLKTISGSFAGGLIRLNGADRVAIDGRFSGSGNFLTFTNNNNTASAATLWVNSVNASNPATDITIRNITVTGGGSSTLAAIVVSGSTMGGAAEADNTNIQIRGTVTRQAQYGIALVGPSAGQTNLVVEDNTVGSTVPAEKISFQGIFASNQNGALIQGNTVAGVSSAASNNDASGITIVGNTTNTVVNGNILNDLVNTNTGGWGISGIRLSSSSTSSNIRVFNNVIYDVRGNGWASNITDNGHGIRITAGGGYTIAYNSVNIATNQTSGGQSSAILISAGSNLDIRNNVFVNTQTTGTRYAIYSSVANTAFTNINYNNYFSAQHVGFLSSNQTTLAAWQTATGQDGMSIVRNPNFTSSTNLLPTDFNGYFAQPISGIITDINGNPRSANAPAKGAFEGTVPGVWLGSSAAWTNTANWSDGSVPGASTMVAVINSTVTQPEITTAVTNTNFLGIAPGCTLTVSNGGALTVDSLRLFGNITLDASASGYGSLVEGTVTGNGTISRRMYLNASTPPNNGRWYTIGSPFAVPINQLHDGTSEFNVTNATESPFRQWNASTGDYELPTGPTMNFERGRGYVAFFGEFVGSTFIRPVPGNITVTGNYGNAANVTRLLGYTSSPTFPTIDGPTDGWNLLANPYLTSYDWNGQALGPNTGGAIYVRNAANTGWVTWNTSETSNRRYIPPMQGFWIRTTLSENLTFDIAQRNTNSTQVIEKPSAQEVLTRIKVTNTANGHDDRAIISFHNDGSAGFDRLLDGYKLRNDAGMHNVYSRSQNMSLALNYLPAFSGTASVPVWFENDQQGTYTFAINRDDIDPSIEITLEDKQTNTTFTFQSSQSVYAFTHTPQMGKDRFILHYNKVNIGQDEYTSRGGIKGLQAWYYDGRINLKSLGFHGPVTARLVDVSGKRIAEEVVTISAGELTRWNVPSLKPGVYMVQLITREGQSTVKFVY